jgi:GNAT superfamily N-acetyltransferase
MARDDYTNYGDWSIDYDDWSSYLRLMRTDLPVTIRPAEPGSRPALDALVDRCSTETLYRRFHGTATGPISHELDRIAAPTADHRSWLAVSPPDGEVHGTATLAWGPAGPEIAFVVEDGWRRRGLGRRLFAAALAEAARAGVGSVGATVQADNERALRFVRSVAPGAVSRYAGGNEVEVSVPVPPSAPAQEAA